LELTPGQNVALDVTINSDEYDMARMEDGTTVDGVFWGKLDIVHQGDTHKMEFTGTRLPADQDYSPEFMFNSRVVAKLAVVSKPTTAKFNLSILAPETQFCDIILSFSPLWKIGMTWPPAEMLEESKVKYFVRVNPGGALEHFDSEMVTTALYYEAMPDPSMVDPVEYVAPRNSYAMTFKDFVRHIMNVLDQLGLSLHARTTFVNNNMAAFSQHKNIAYRFLSPSKVAAAVDITVAAEPCLFTRLFLMFRGISDDEMGEFSGAGEKEANAVNWRSIVGWSEDSKDPSQFRILETAVLEVS
jgi:hypothetical protein